ncbi:hypothetical protein M878_40980 [Streptomyces roseochromogenus subsp. oscitans DS 12.976]|uniref:Luciferase-like domain-containing protein n=1 Tax=Streptomyces roseochromogenus subsp. oscitans DS 12.976 TaxID=1352936 RepID=V6JST0_STRRC|nr:hypothetical protein M878_40980 [Streptomyces roseochromogenus subsp. oscitans DS 12.976]
MRDFSLTPKPLSTPERPHPEIFQGGNSTAARWMAGRVSDWYFSNGKDFDGVVEQIADVPKSAPEVGRRAPKIGLNGFLIAYFGRRVLPPVRELEAQLPDGERPDGELHHGELPDGELPDGEPESAPAHA